MPVNLEFQTLSGTIGTQEGLTLIKAPATIYISKEGALLGSSWELLGALGRSLEALWELWGAPGELSGAPWELLGGSGVLLGEPLGALWGLFGASGGGDEIAEEARKHKNSN